MPITIKPGNFKYKNPTSGDYDSVDVLSDKTTSEQVAAITAEGTTQLNAIDAKAAQALASISDISELEGMISGVFNAANNYTAGEYVIQEVNNVNKLYKFTADYTANDGWSNAQVVEVKIGNEMTDLKSAFDSTLNKISKTENVALTYEAKVVLNSAGNRGSSNTHALLYKISVVGVSQVTVTSARYSSWSTAGPLIAFYSTDVYADMGENTCVGIGTIHSDGNTYTETYAVPSTAVCAYVQSCDVYGDPTVVAKSIKILEDISSLENIVGKETVSTFTKTGTSNATKYIAHPIAVGQTLMFKWETDGGSNQSMNLFTRNSSSGENIETVKLAAHPGVYYEFTATLDAAGLFLSATASGTIHIFDIGTLVGDLEAEKNTTSGMMGSIEKLENTVGKEISSAFTKTGTNNATKFISYPVSIGQTIMFKWETEGNNRQTLNLFTRNSASGDNIETVKSTAYPNVYYTFTATAEAAGLFLSATVSGTIIVYTIGTVIGDLKKVENDIGVIGKKILEAPFVKFGFSDIMYDPSEIFAENGEIGQIASWTSKAEALSKVHAAFDALCASSNGYGTRIQNLYKESENDEAQFDILAPSYVTNGVTQGETVTLDIGTDINGDPVTYSYTYESSTDPYEVRLYKFQETNNALHTGNVDIPKKKLLLIGGTHGNEFCAPINLYVFAKHLCTDYSNPDMLKLRSAFDVYVIPYLNGFGCQYKWNNQGYVSTGSRSNGHMVDINRNCDTLGWVGATGTAEQITANFESKIANLGTNTFAGPSNGSEFESKLVKAIVEWIQPNVVIDHHHNDGSSPIYAMAYDRTGGMQIYQAVNDIAYSYMKNFPEYYGTAYNLFLSSTVSPASLTAKNGYVTTMTGEMGVQMSATEEMPEAIAWSNGTIDFATKAATRYSANAFETAEYTLLCVVLHLCQYAMEH